MLEKKPYLLARLVSGLGNSLYGMVFIWWIQIQTKSSTMVGITNAIFTVTAALSIFMVLLLTVTLLRKPASILW